MKIVLIAMLLTVSAFAQSPSSQIALACGPQGINFDVKLDNSQHTVVQPAPGKAQVYFIQDRSLQSFRIGEPVVSMIGIDGAWTGENKNDSYFSVSVEPGEHHVCAHIQPRPIELSHFIAEAGNIYYFRERIIPSAPFGVYLSLNLVDSDEAKYLIATYPLSVSHLKK
jgi:hypothetical protein